MKYHDMTKEQLISKLVELNRRVTELEESEKELEKTKEALSSAHTQLDATLDALPDFMFEVDRYGHIYDYRAQNPKLLYKSPQEFLGKMLKDLLPKETNDIIMDSIGKAVEKGRHTGTTYYLETPAGPGWFELSIAAKGDPKAPDGRLIALIHDITKQREAEEALRVSERKYRDLIENSIDIHYLVDIEGNFVEVNDSFLKEGDYDPEDIIGKNLGEFLHPEDESIAQKALEKGITGEPFEFEMRAKQKDGSFGWYSYNNRPVKDQEGKVTAIHGIARAITGRKKAEEALRIEREQLLSLFDSINQIIYVVDPKTYEIVYANNALKDAFNKDPIGGICYREFQDLESPCDFCTNEIILKKKGEPYQWEHHNPYIDRDFMLIDRIIRWPDGRDVRFEIAFDITERKNAEKELKESEEKYSTLIETSPDAIATCDLSGKINYASPQTAKMYGYDSADELIGIDLLELASPEDMERAESGFRELLKKGILRGLECTHLRKDGSTFIGESNAALIRDIDGEPKAAIAITRDITERRRFEERFLRAQKMEAVATLSGGVAHDFNNILTTILGYASFLKSKAKEGDGFYIGLSAIENSALRASELTSQLLAYSRKGKLEVKPLNLNRVINEVYDLISKTFHKSIKISLKTDDSIKAVEGDGSQLNQVVMNIVINAQDAMPDGGTFKIQTYMEDVKRKIEKKYYIIEPGEYVCMKFIDNGIGMDEDTLKKIFEPYFTTKGNMGGTGLGMSVVFGIVKGHGGYIDVKSKLGIGTEITIRLPASKDKEEIFQEEPEEVVGGSETLLIIDDEKDILSMLKGALENLGYKVYTSSSGRTGLKTFKEKDIDLVILDIKLPDIGGKEVLEKIFEIDPKAKVLLESGYSDMEQHKNLIEIGARGFIGKPFEMNKLFKKIREVL